MKSRLVLTAACSLLLVAGVSNAVERQQDEQSSAHATMKQNANESAQSSTDMSYGGVPDTRMEAGNTPTRACSARPQCNIFFGH
ncbi:MULTISPECIES: hypothetical protein [Paraburkholderia]|uniref:hypothetical protein n=1 Tax=Paraburkholderia TaxID=1822464 RepID=UPI0016564473|nr:hypothetical protein [Paraburkholderia podalyriae]